MDRPLPNSYWIEHRRFAAGEYPGDTNTAAAEQKLRALLTAGVDTFVDLTELDEGLKPYASILTRLGEELDIPVSHQRFPIRDVGVPLKRGQMRCILDAIDAARGQGRVVYVHCWGGIGRTGTVVGCWFVRHGYSGSDALAQLAELWRGVEKSRRRPRSPETPEQERYVRNWNG